MLSITSIVYTLQRVIGENTRLVDIEHADILHYRKELLTGTIINPAMPNLTRQGRAPSTVNKQMAVLSEMPKLANRSQFILHAPYEGVSRLKLSKNDPDPLLLHKYQALITTLPRSQALIIIVAVYTGMRPGEIGALAWEDDAHMVYEIYSKWIGDINQDRVNMLNNQMPTALPPERPTGRGA